MIKRLTEVGIAVEDVTTAGAKLLEILGARPSKLIEADGYGMRAQMYRVANVDFELMEPNSSGGVIRTFLDRHGEGFHHLAFEVKDLQNTINVLKKRGIRLINEEPVRIAGLEAIFLHPDSLGSILIELIEGTPKWVDDTPLPESLVTPEGPIGLGGIQEVAIRVRNVSAVSAVLDALLPDVALSGPGAGLGTGERVFRIREGYLRLIGQSRDNEHEPRRKDSFGLEYVAFKVGDVKTAANYLESKGIPYTKTVEDHFCNLAGIRIGPEQLLGVPLLLVATLS